MDVEPIQGNFTMICNPEENGVYSVGRTSGHDRLGIALE